MLCGADSGTSDLRPVDLALDRFVYEADETNIVASDDVEAEGHRLGIIRIIGCADDSLQSIR